MSTLIIYVRFPLFSSHEHLHQLQLTGEDLVVCLLFNNDRTSPAYVFYSGFYISLSVFIYFSVLLLHVSSLGDCTKSLSTCYESSFGRMVASSYLMPQVLGSTPIEGTFFHLFFQSSRKAFAAIIVL